MRSIKKIPLNQYDIRTSNDIISYLSKFQPYENKILTIPSESDNLSKEHRYQVLDRLDPDMMIGDGKHKSKPTVKELKEYIKKNRKKSNKKILIQGMKKAQLYQCFKELEALN